MHLYKQSPTWTPQRSLRGCPLVPAPVAHQPTLNAPRVVQRRTAAVEISGPPSSSGYESSGSTSLDAALSASSPSAVTGPDYSANQRNLALELVRVTEAAALAAGRWFGKGDKNAADQAAVDMMRKVLSGVQMDGVVVIGEGEKDEAPMLYCGERIGDGSNPKVDIAVDPLDGTTLTAQGRNGAVSVIALAERGALFDPGPCMYMEKLALGPDIDPELVNLSFPLKHNLKWIAKSLNKPISDVTVVILDRPRHAELIKGCREAGCRIRLISDGDVAGAIEVAKPGASIDAMMGIGGTPEGVIAAAALKCMGGSLQGRLWPRNEEERRLALERGYELDKILMTSDLVRGDDVFFAATGVSDGDLLKGVRYYAGGASTNSLVMRCKSGTVRFVETYHKWHKPSLTNISEEEMAAIKHAVGGAGNGKNYIGGQAQSPW